MSTPMTPPQHPGPETEMNRKNLPRTAVVVLGMHRSGTSALAGVLSLLGCDQPTTLMVPNKNNEKGYFESGKLYQLHTQLFASAASRWDDWLPMPAGWFGSARASEFHDRALTTMTGEFGGSSLFVLKDPRICRLVPFWEDVLAAFGATPAYVLTHRNPLEVASSLHKRDGMSIGLGMLIWLRHILEAEAGTRGHRRCFTSFGQLISNWPGVADKIQKTFALNFPRFSLGAAPEVDAFLLGEMRHHKEAPETVLHNPLLSVWVRDTYEIFERWAEKGEDSADYDRLDATRAAFDAAAPAFAQVLLTCRDEARQCAEQETALRTELDEAQAGREAVAAELQETQARLASLLEAVGAAEAGREAVAAELQETQARLVQEQEALRAEAQQHERVQAEMRAEMLAATQQLDRERAASAQAIEREASARTTAETRNAEFNTRLQTQFRELSDLTRLLADSEQAAATARTQTETLQSELAVVQGDLAVVRNEIAVLRTSTSWRMTQPLRSVVDRMRGTRR